MDLNPVPVDLERLKSAADYSEWSFAEWGPGHELFLPDAEPDPQPVLLERTFTVTEYSEWSFAEWAPPGGIAPCPATVQPAAAVWDPGTGSLVQASALGHAVQAVAGEAQQDPPVVHAVVAQTAPASEAPLQRAPHPEEAPPPQQPEQHLQSDPHPRDAGRARRSTGAPAAKPDAGPPAEQRLLQLLEGSASDCSQALVELQGRVWQMSCEKLGCRVVQAAIHHAPRAQAEKLVKELHFHVRESLVSPHANFVIQRVVEKLPASASAFVAQELLADAREMAVHRFGCRIVIRLIEHTASHPSTVAVIKEVLAACVELSCHRFGRHIILAILEQLETYRHEVLTRIQRRARAMAKHRDGSYVVEKALQVACQDDQTALARALVGGGRDPILDLAKDGSACFVVRALANMKATPTLRQLSRKVLEEVFSAEAELRESGAGGARVVKELEPKFRAMARAQRQSHT